VKCRKNTHLQRIDLIRSRKCNRLYRKTLGQTTQSVCVSEITNADLSHFAGDFHKMASGKDRESSKSHAFGSFGTLDWNGGVAQLARATVS
jgi:hypothetical protein